MALVFPRQRDSPGSVLGKWKPRTVVGRLEYALWGMLGAPFVALVYAVAVVGSPVRFVVRRIGRLADTWGLAGVVWFAAIVGGVATAMAWLGYGRAGFVAVAVAAGVSTLTVSLSMTVSRVRGRSSTVLLAYPLGVVAVGLVPIVVATYSTGVPGAVLQRTAGSLPPGAGVPSGLDGRLRPDVVSTRTAVVAAWTGAAALAGWLAGTLVTITDAARPVDG